MSQRWAKASSFFRHFSYPGRAPDNWAEKRSGRRAISFWPTSASIAIPRLPFGTDFIHVQPRTRYYCKINPLVMKLTGIFLQLPGSPAELDGRLQKGDLLVSVDGKDVSKGDYVAAATALKLCGNKTSIKVKRFKIVR